MKKILLLAAAALFLFAGCAVPQAGNEPAEPENVQADSSADSGSADDGEAAESASADGAGAKASAAPEASEEAQPDAPNPHIRQSAAEMGLTTLQACKNLTYVVDPEWEQFVDEAAETLFYDTGDETLTVHAVAIDGQMRELIADAEESDNWYTFITTATDGMCSPTGDGLTSTFAASDSVFGADGTWLTHTKASDIQDEYYGCVAYDDNFVYHMFFTSPDISGSALMPYWTFLVSSCEII